MKLNHLIGLCAALSLFIASVSHAADSAGKRRRVSPADVVTASIGGNEIKINYGRPYTKDPKTGEPRQIWGGLVPYGKVWRTGANEATVLTLTKPIVIGGFDLPAGKYSLFTVPTDGPGAKLIINKKTGQWGIPYKESEEKPNELARVDLTRGTNPAPLDQFTITIDETGPDAGQIKFAWADAYYAVDFHNKS